tara:strand:+ start:194 stop:1240 length:1047 start_codon:yes stop_codon:yes gene_type:complete
MKKLIKLLNGKEILLDTDKIPNPLIHPGSEFIETTILANSDVYVPEKDSISNSVRTGNVIDITHSERLGESFNQKGINYDFHPPYAYKENVTCPLTGKKYKFRTRGVGNHRKEAFKIVGATHWIYNVFQPFTDSFLEIDAGFITNDHSPSLVLNKAAIINNLTKMVNDKRWGKLSKENLEKKLKEYLSENCSSIHGNAKSHIVKQVLHSQAEYTDHVEYTPDEAEQWISNYTDRKTDFKVDKKRNIHGAVVGEGYEKKKLMLAIMKYGETKLPSEFIGHVKQPLSTDKSRGTTKLKRESMLQQFKDIESDLDAVFEYKKKHGEYPFKLVSFIPQDRLNKEDSEKELLI